jgi:peptidoglycan/xylan/chitin deacetylase (PgdA/CDA1 family)
VVSRLAILTYHPIHIVANTYAGSDLVALERDLATIERLGLTVVSLDQAITAPGDGELLADLGGPAVAITFDDGSVFDFVDHDHPTCGPQRSAATILREAAGRLRCLGRARPLATTFVIASPAARTELDRKDYFGGGYWPERWWREAAEGDVLAVESHSWDHNHPSLERSLQRDNHRGTFTNIETFAEAEGEIAQSVAYIARTTGAAPRFFAYPWGEANDYLMREYMPRRGPELGLKAAVSSSPQAAGFVTSASERWRVPRLVAGNDWKTPEALESLLADFARAA